jgi:2-dehydropantoate 2-reductase
MTSERIAVIGMGGVGCYYAGMLARAGHQISALARGANLAAIRSSGLTIRTPEDSWTVRIAASDDPRELSADFGAGDLAIVATKAYSLDEVAPAVGLFAERGATILPLLNGVEAAERLTALGVSRERILGGVTYISAVRTGPGVAERKSPFQRVIVGEPSGGLSDRAKRVATIFSEAGVEASATDNVTLALWQKFVFLASISGVCGLARSTVGAVRTIPAGRRSFDRAVHEAVAVGRARGVPLPENEEARVMAQIDALPDGTRPSLLLDLEAGSRTEVAVLSGAVSRMGEEAGIETPVHDAVATACVLAAKPKAEL